MSVCRAYRPVLLALSLLSCRIQNEGTAVPGPSDAAAVNDGGTIDGGRSGSDAGARGGQGGQVHTDGAPADHAPSTGGAGGSAPMDAPVEAPGPLCLAPMKECAGSCIAANACCHDDECPAMATGQIGKCDGSSRTCQYMCGADSKPCGGQCIPAAACCADADCAGNVACVAGSCSTTACRGGFKRCGTTCIASTTCCRADGCCANSDCGPCKKCAQGACVNQAATEDLKNDCPSSACHTGTCDGAGACAASPDGDNGPGCAGECQSCKAGACEAHAGVCGMGQMCDNGRCPPRPPVAVRINVNGPQHGQFAADPGVGGVCDGQPFQTTDPIAGTTDDPLYQGEMFGAPLGCAVGGGTLPAGRYHVNLYFAEIYWGPGCVGGGPGTGARVFDVQLEGDTLASHLDVFSEGNCAAAADGSGHPIMKSFTITIADGTLNLTLPAEANNAKISAIEILSDW
jgi:hypothetical protein